MAANWGCWATRGVCHVPRLALAALAGSDVKFSAELNTNKIGVEKTCYLLLHYEGWLPIGSVNRLGVFAMCLATRWPAAAARLCRFVLRYGVQQS